MKLFVFLVALGLLITGAVVLVAGDAVRCQTAECLANE